MNEGQLRDQLAVERTHLANERTLLAYIRTALGSAAAGAALLQFFPPYSSLVALAWLLVAAGGVILTVGHHCRGRIRGSREEEARTATRLGWQAVTLNERL